MIPPGARILLRASAVDFRKGPEGLVSLVRDAGADPFDGSVHVFRAKRADRIKIVWWDGSGLCLFAKRLERSHFCWPMAGSHEIRLSYAQATGVVARMPSRSSRMAGIVQELFRSEPCRTSTTPSADTTFRRCSSG